MPRAPLLHALVLIILAIGASDAKRLSAPTSSNETASNNTALTQPALNETALEQPASNETALKQPASNETSLNQTRQDAENAAWESICKCLNAGVCVVGIDYCYCRRGFKGKRCEINIDDCHHQPCLNGGTCNDLVETYTCKCPAGFTGLNCEFRDSGRDPCRPNPCQNNGDCQSDGDNFMCKCTCGYAGNKCELQTKSVEDGAIRLVDGSTPYEGRIEIFHAGRWGTICDDRWTMNNAKVACKQLGYGKAISWVRAAGFGQGLGTQPLMLDNLVCTGFEDKVSNCGHAGWEVSNCVHSEDVGVKCEPPSRILSRTKGNDKSEPQCTHSARLDLQLIIDSSHSIGSSNFESMMTGIADGLISQFEIGEDKTRVALSIFNENTYNIFGLDKYTDASSLKEAIKTLKYNAGGTWTAKAMKEALISYKEKMRDDHKIARACVVFTDGNANDDKFLQEASKAWADQDVVVFAVGIGNMVSEFGLEKITSSSFAAHLEANNPSSKSNERIMTNFKIIGGKAKSLLARVCKVISNRGLRIDTIPKDYYYS